MKASEVQTKFIDAGGHRFAYREIGSGFPIVLFQRFRGTMDDWDPAFIDCLARENRVVIFDNVGIGATSGQTPDTILGIAHDAFEFTRGLGLTKFNIGGWSLGGIVAQVFALTYQQSVNKIVLIGTGPGRSAETVYPGERFLEIARHDENTLADHQVLFFTDTPAGLRYTQTSLERIAQRTIDVSPATRKANWMNQALAMRDFFGGPVNYFARLCEITQPVLIGAAKQDLAFTLVNAYLLVREIPNAKLIVYPDAGHGFHHQYVENFGELINQFLAERA